MLDLRPSLAAALPSCPIRQIYCQIYRWTHQLSPSASDCNDGTCWRPVLNHQKMSFQHHYLRIWLFLRLSVLFWRVGPSRLANSRRKRTGEKPTRTAEKRVAEPELGFCVEKRRTRFAYTIIVRICFQIYSNFKS